MKTPIPASYTQVCKALYQRISSEFGTRNDFFERIEIRDRREQSFYITEVKISGNLQKDRFAFVSLSKNKGVFGLWPRMPDTPEARYEEWFVTNPILTISCLGLGSDDIHPELGERKRENLEMKLGYFNGSLELSDKEMSYFVIIVMTRCVELSSHLGKPASFYMKERFPLAD